MAIISLLTPGRLLIVLGNLFYSIGAFVADFNETHVRNPRWPPHAKFHNGQTMTLGILLAAASIYLNYRSTAARSATAAKERLWWAATIGSFYCLAGLSAILYPGTEWVDAEFVRPDGVTQQPVFATIIVMMWIGYAIEAWRLS